ncbi:GET complex subunit get1 [Apiotrichum porosum]|uniref:GET complex subunit get1 n=1 Tax=Apiotrichum porosum TaxID=105984 RepID=A0A427XS76_9TREE|nr:GET complex subunit get1 [Apiotrichum porosum]RSH81694.1 GET complex subunit get1 [Apiotrichum porosum]
MADPNLAVIIFLVVLLTQVVAWIGKSVLQEAAFSAYSSIFLSKAHRDQSRLRKQVLEDKAELNRTSSQDEFAKWAKLRRKVDKGIADLEKTNAVLASSRSTFGFRFNTLIWIATTGAQLVLVWWYRRQPVFWLPAQWVPAPVAYILRFPSAPKGSVSSAAWGTVCKRVLTSVEEIVKPFFQPAPPVAEPMGVPVAVPEKQTATIQEVEHDGLD